MDSAFVVKNLSRTFTEVAACYDFSPDSHCKQFFLRLPE